MSRPGLILAPALPTPNFAAGRISSVSPQLGVLGATVGYVPDLRATRAGPVEPLPIEARHVLDMAASGSPMPCTSNSTVAGAALNGLNEKRRRCEAAIRAANASPFGANS